MVLLVIVPGFFFEMKRKISPKPQNPIQWKIIEIDYFGCSEASVLGVHGGPDRVLVDEAGAQRGLLGANSVCAELHEAVLAPVRTPRVADDPVVVALHIRVNSVVSSLRICLTIPDDQHSVVDLPILIAAVKELLGQDSSAV